ncbi:hypothetical protein [Spirosoma sp. 48-14]|nr:hypothetical protein [Spirosoma sp. 48-14]
MRGFRPALSLPAKARMLVVVPSRSVAEVQHGMGFDNSTFLGGYF